MSAARDGVAVLLLHGLTSTPADVAPLTDGLARAGYSVRVPLLPGRGTSAADLERLCWEDWMSAALSEYDDLARTYRAVVVGGLSAGATMALDVGLRRKPSALLLYATALALTNRFAFMAPYVWRVVRRWPSAPSDRIDTTLAAPAYDPLPLRAVGELVRAIRRVRRHLREITAPALVAHAVTDRVVPVACANALARSLGGPVTTLFVEGSGHSITVDARRDLVVDATVDFLARTLRRPEVAVAHAREN